MKRLLGFLAVAGLVALAAPTGQAQAAALISPVAAGSAKFASDNLTVQVRHGGGGGGFHGGGGHFGGGGFRGGGFHGGGFRAFHHGPRFFFGPGFGYTPYPYVYPGYYAGPRLYCRWVWTDFGPRRICRYRPWWA